MTDAEFLALLMDQATGPRFTLPRMDLLRVLRLAGREDTDVYRAVALDERDTFELWSSSMRWLVRVIVADRVATETRLRRAAA